MSMMQVRYTIMAPSILLREATAELASISDSSSQVLKDGTFTALGPRRVDLPELIMLSTSIT